MKPPSGGPLPAIRRLPPGLVNRIAAGEVVERPASAIKELVENALDAGAARITVELAEGGRSLIAVTDDGAGMTPQEIELAVERHATSKLPGDDLVRITSLGFRGEALAALGAVGRMRITSRPPGQESAFALAVVAGDTGPAAPAPGAYGTRVEVLDLFFATPARLKFLKSDRAESQAAREVVERLAIAHPEVAFDLLLDGRRVLVLEPSGSDPLEQTENRLRAIMGREFGESALLVDAERDGIHLFGFAGLPTLARTTQRFQHWLVNRRPVQDRLLRGALRAAYGDLLFQDRQPMAALFVQLAPERVDVNVHPTKAEVRFREPGVVRGLVIGTLKACAGRGRLAHLDQPRRGGARRLSRRGEHRQRPARRPRRDGGALPGAGCGPGRACARRAERAARAAARRRRRALPAWAPRAPSCTTATSSPRRRTGCCWSTSMRRTSAWSTSA